MKFALYQFEGKELYLRQALYAAGHTESDRIDDTDLLLVDTDAPWAYPRPDMIRAAKAAGAKVALYPHGGLPVCWMYDGICEPDPNVDLRLEHGPGNLEIADAIGLDLKQEAPGWLYSPTQPFAPVETSRKVLKVLFAPLHPIIEGLANPEMNGFDPAPAWNQRIYKELLKWKYELTVSVVGPAHRSGIWPHARANIVGNHGMMFTGSYQQVMEADVVVAAGSMAALAVACGKPTITFAQDNFQDYAGGTFPQAARPELYRDLIRYPLDADHVGYLHVLILQACAGDNAAEWRKKFVGDDGADEAVKILERLVAGADVIVTGATATAAGTGGV